MGTRRKQPLTVYLDATDPVLAYLKRFKDMSAEATRLLTIGLSVVNVTPKSTGQAVLEAVTVTVQPNLPQQGLVTVTKPETPTPSRPKAAVMESLDPDWDD